MSHPPFFIDPESERRRLAALVDDLDAVVWEVDARTMRFTFVSGGLERVLGHTQRDWLAAETFWADHVHPDDRERIVSQFVHAVTAGWRFETEYRFRARGGAYVWLHDVGHVVRDADGSVALVRGVMTDVTKRRHAEEERATAEARFRRIVERLPAIVYIEAVRDDPERARVTLYVSPQVESILGFAPREWMDDPGARQSLLHPDDRERVRGEYERAERLGEPFGAEYRMVTRDGRVVWFHDEAVLVRDDDGRPLFWQGVMHDVTAQHTSEALAEETESRYRTLVERLPAIVYSEGVADERQHLVYVNPRVRELLGISPGEWLADPDRWARAIHPDDRDRVLEENARTERTGEPFSMEYRMRTRDGRVLWFRDEAVLVRDAAGAPRYWQGVMVDITAQKEAQELARDLEVERETAQRLRELDEMKNTFLQAVSHDLRTPLAAILGLAVTMERPDLEISATERRDMARRIAQNARRLDRLVADLLDLDRLSRGIIEPTFRPADVGALVRELVEGSDVTAERRVQLDTQRVVIPVDAAKVERIVENLLGNTVKHTPEHTRIWVRVGPWEDGALLLVEDDGPGVPPDQRERVFEPFQQAATVSPHAPGVGVGLSLVARFAELHDGRAWVEDRAGGGASFRVFLPARPSGYRPDEDDEGEHTADGDPAQPTGTDSEASQA